MTDERDLSDHVPMRGSDGKPRCEACGYLFPCPDLRLAPRALEASERALLEVLEIGVGFEVYRRLPDGSDGVGPGGVVVGAWTDDDGVHLRVVQFPGGKPDVLEMRLHEIEPATIELPNALNVRNTARRLAAVFSKGTGLLDDTDCELLSDALQLVKAAS